jgi:hypothetical protein
LQLVVQRRRQIPAPQLPFYAGHHQRLLPGPHHRAVIIEAGEFAAQFGIGQHGIRDQHAHVGQQPGREWPQYGVDAAFDVPRRRIGQQQAEAFVRVQHWHRQSLFVQ